MSSDTLTQKIDSNQDQPVDLDFLTPEERDVILEVLARDENLKRKEEERIELLKKEIRELRAEEFSRISFDVARLCGRCLQEFHWLFNRGQICSKCRLRVCKKCRQLLHNKAWICLVCLRILELESQTGKWFYADYPQNRKNMSSCQIISALDLLRSSLNQSTELNDDVMPSIGQFGNHTTSVTCLPNVFTSEDDEEELEKMSDSDSLSYKFHFSSTPNLSFKSTDKGSLTNLYVTDVDELQQELPSRVAYLSPKHEDDVFHLNNLGMEKHPMNDDFQSVPLAENGEKAKDNNTCHVHTSSDLDKTLVEREEILIYEKNGDNPSHNNETSNLSVKIVVAEEEDLQNDVTMTSEPMEADNDEEDRKESIGEESISPGSSSDAVRLKVGALLAKYGRQDVTTSYSTIYNSILNTNREQKDDENNNDDEHHQNDGTSMPDALFSKTDSVSKSKDDFFPLEPVRPHTLDRKYRSANDESILEIQSVQQSIKESPSAIEEHSPAVESLGTEDDDDDPIRRFLKNEALLQKKHADDCGFSSAVSWVTGKSYDLDWEASDEEVPFSIQDFDHVSTGFLDDDDDDEDDDGRDKGAFSDLRSVIDNILFQSSHDKPNQEECEDDDDEEEEEEKGDILLLPVSSSHPIQRNGIPMLRKKSLSVISEHTEPSACSSFDESTFSGDLLERDEITQQNPSSSLY